MKDCNVMCRGPTGAVWRSWIARNLFPSELMTWPTREGAQAAADMQGAAVVPANTVGVRS